MKAQPLRSAGFPVRKSSLLRTLPGISFLSLSSVKLVRKPGDAQQLAGAGSVSQLHLVDGTDQSVELAPAKSTFDLLSLARS